MKRKMMGAFAGFLAVMLLFTFLSRAADSVSIARVTVQKPKQGKINHVVKGSGKVVQNREQAVSTLAGQTVKTIFVEEGQQVAAGDLLFEIDVESLQEQILERKQEMKKEELQAKDRASSRDVQAQQNAVGQSRAAEDYQVAAGKSNTAISRAASELSRAKKKLAALDKNNGSGGGTDAVEAVLEETCEQKAQDYEDAVAYKEKLQKAIDDAVAQALEDAADKASASSLMPLTRETVQTAPDGDGSGTGTETAAQTAPPQQAVGNAESVAGTNDLTQTETPTQIPEIETDSDTNAGSGTEADGWTDTGSDTETDMVPETEEPLIEDGGEVIVGGGTQSPGDFTGGVQQPDGSFDTSETDTQQTEDPWLLEQRIRQENQPLLDEAERQILLKEQEMEAADAALATYLQEKAAGTQMSTEQMREQIKAEIRTLQQAYDDAVTAGNDSLRSAGRAIEDANAPKASDSTGEIDEITREQAELQLAKLERLLEQEGKVVSPIDATVTKINLLTGEKTPDGTAVLLSDSAAGSKLVVQVSESQDQYIARGDKVTVKAESGKNVIKDLTVDTVRLNEQDAQLLDVTVQLPADALETGVAATMESVRVSETYNRCIPLSALYEENGQYFVYVLEERSTVLGTEQVARKVAVNVLEKNETDAAIQEGAVTGEQQVIVSADKIISEGSRVRLAQ